MHQRGVLRERSGVATRTGRSGPYTQTALVAEGSQPAFGDTPAPPSGITSAGIGTLPFPRGNPSPMAHRILCVCLGNICRSPHRAEAALRAELGTAP